MKRILVLAGIGALLAGLIGCGGGSSGTNLTATSLVGTWRATGLRSPGGTSVTCPGSVTLSDNSTSECGAEDDTIFREDGTIAFLDGAIPTGIGTWSLSGSTLHLVFPTSGGQAFSLDASVALSGNTLTLTIQSLTPSQPGSVGLATTMEKR